MNTGDSKLAIITVLYVLSLAVVLLFPFRFENPRHFEKTDVRKLPGTGGVEIASTSAILTPTPPRGLYDSLVSGSGVSIEMVLSPASGQRETSMVLTYSYGMDLGNFELMQDHDDLIFVVKTDTADPVDPERRITVDDVMTPGRTRHIVLSYDHSIQRAFVDGEEAAISEPARGGFANWAPSHLLMLGNVPHGNLPWRGRIYKLAIYNRPLTRSEVIENYRAGKSFPPGSRAEEAGVTEGLVALYLFNTPGPDKIRDLSGTDPMAHLHIPERIRVTDKEFLEPPFRGLALKFNTLMDIAVNIALFAPLGFLSFTLMRGLGFSLTLSCAVVLTAGAALSLGAEMLQYFVDDRVSSMTDIVNNSIGLAVGILTGYFYVNAGTQGMTGTQG